MDCRRPLELFPDNFWTTTDLGETGGKEDNMGNTNPIETGTNKEDGIDKNNLGKPVIIEDANFFQTPEGGRQWCWIRGT